MTAKTNDQAKRRRYLAQMSTYDLGKLIDTARQLPWAFKREEIRLAKLEQSWRASFYRMTDNSYNPKEDYRDRQV